MKYVVVGDPIPPEFGTAAGVNRLLGRIEALRAVLAPLLDEPAERWNDEHKAMECLFCHGTNVGEPEDYHKPNCPVLRRDELLGRTSTTTENALS